MFDQYLAVGSTEIVNAERVQRYVENVFPQMPLKRFPSDAIVVSPAVNNFQDYTDPISDSAPWYSPTEPWTAEFFGAYPLGTTGIGDSTMSADVTESIGEGGSVGAERDATRSIKVSALLLGSSRQGVESGLAWLRKAVRTQECSMHGTLCPSVDMSYFLAQPVAVPPAVVATNLATDPKPNATASVTVIITNGAAAKTIAANNRYSPSAQAVRTTWSAETTGAWKIGETGIAITGGESIAFSVWGLMTWATTQNINLQMVYKDTSGNVVATVEGPASVAQSNVYYPLTYQDTAPEAATTVDVYWQSDGNGQGPIGVHTTRTNLAMYPNAHSAANWVKTGSGNALTIRDNTLPVYQGSGKGFAIYGGVAAKKTGVYTMTQDGLTIGGNYVIAFWATLSANPNVSMVVDTKQYFVDMEATGASQVDPTSKAIFKQYVASFAPAATSVTLTITVKDGTNIAIAAMSVIPYVDAQTEYYRAWDYFDGYTPSEANGYSYAWTGAVSASTSIETLTGDYMDFTSVLVEQGQVDTIDPYFDGDSANDESYTYDWSATPDASTSIKTTNPLSTQLAPYKRVYHDVACTSGPTIIKEVEFGPGGCNGYGIQVEMLFTAASPRPFGEMQGVTISSSPTLITPYRDTTGPLQSLIANGANNGGAMPWTLGVNIDGSSPSGISLVRATMPTPAIDSSITASPYVAQLTLPTTVGAVTALAQNPGVAGTADANTPYSYAVYVMATSAMSLAIAAYQGASGKPYQGNYQMGFTQSVAANTWTRLILDQGAQPNYASAYRRLVLMNVTAATLPANSKIYITAAQIIPQGGIANQPYFDGDTPVTPTNAYYWQGGYPPNAGIIAVQATSIDSAVPHLLQDPNLPIMPNSPAAPTVSDAVVAKTSTWDRRVYPIPAQDIPAWADGVPTINFSNGPTNVVRQVRVRFFEDLDGDGTIDDPNAAVGDFLLSYLPGSGAVQIDGVSQATYAEIGSSGMVDGSGLLYSGSGGPPKWPVLSSGVPYLMAIDVPSGAPLPSVIGLSITRRE